MVHIFVPMTKNPFKIFYNIKCVKSKYALCLKVIFMIYEHRATLKF